MQVVLKQASLKKDHSRLMHYADDAIKCVITSGIMHQDAASKQLHASEENTLPHT